MTAARRSPVPLADLVELWAATRLLTPRLLRAAILQAARSESVGWYAGGRLVAAAVLYPCAPERPGEDLRELAFAMRPEAAPHLLAIVNYARLTRRSLAEIEHLRLRATVRAGHRPGERLCRLIGFKPAGTHDGRNRYEWSSHERHG